MRLFIQHDSKGNVISVSKVEIMDASLAHPYGGLAKEESALEVEPTSELQALDCHEISERYFVDMKKMKLKKRSSSA